MGKRRGPIRRLASGRWQARYLTPDGDSLTTPNTFTTKAEEAAFPASVETDVRRGAWTVPTTVTEVALAEYDKSWIAERTVKGRPLALRTIDTYLHSLRYSITPTIGQRRPVDIGPTDIRTWHQSVMSQTGPTATRQAYALLHAVFTTAVADDLVTRTRAAYEARANRTAVLICFETVDALAAACPPTSTRSSSSRSGGLHASASCSPSASTTSISRPAASAPCTSRRRASTPSPSSSPRTPPSRHASVRPPRRQRAAHRRPGAPRVGRQCAQLPQPGCRRSRFEPQVRADLGVGLVAHAQVAE